MSEFYLICASTSNSHMCIYMYLSLLMCVCVCVCVCPGGSWSLSKDDIECVAVGAGLLGCGGGGDPNTGRLIALQQLASGSVITVMNPLRYGVCNLTYTVELLSLRCMQ